MTERYLSGGPEFLDPAEYPPPRATTINLLTSDGTSIKGVWADAEPGKRAPYIGWHPLLRVPEHLKERMR